MLLSLLFALSAFGDNDDIPKPWIQKSLLGITIGTSYRDTKKDMIIRFGEPHFVLNTRTKTADTFVIETDQGTLVRIEKSDREDAVGSIVVMGRSACSHVILPRSINVGMPSAGLSVSLKNFAVHVRTLTDGVEHVVADSNVSMEIYRNTVRSIKISELFARKEEGQEITYIEWLKETVGQVAVDLNKLYFPSEQEYQSVERLRAAKSNDTQWLTLMRQNSKSSYIVKEYIRHLLAQKQYVLAHKLLKKNAKLFGDDPSLVLLQESLREHTQSLSEASFEKAQRSLQAKFAEIDVRVIERSISGNPVVPPPAPTSQAVSTNDLPPIPKASPSPSPAATPTPPQKP